MSSMTPAINLETALEILAACNGLVEASSFFRVTRK